MLVVPGGVDAFSCLPPGAQISPMFLHHTSIQQRRAACAIASLQRRMSATPCLLKDYGADEGSGNERLDPPRARSRINLTKAAIVAVMREFDRPLSAEELYAIWNGDKPLGVFEYRLSMLVAIGVAEPVITKAEILFRLVREGGGGISGFSRERCR